MSLFESTKHQGLCPDCGGLLHIRRGKRGLFLGCTNYPSCHYLKPLQQSSHIIKTLDEICPECGNLLQLKQGAFGIFIGCSGYPKCHFIVHEQNETENEDEIKCPECQKGHLLKRSGRLGKVFYGCSEYPKCRFTLATKPLEKTCPMCNFPFVIAKNRQYQCINKTCQHLFSDKNNDEL